MFFCRWNLVGSIGGWILRSLTIQMSSDSGFCEFYNIGQTTKKHCEKYQGIEYPGPS